MDYFKLFSNCVVTKGVNRHLISDLQQGLIYFASSDLLEIVDLVSTQGLSVSHVRELYDINNEMNQNVISEYLEFLEGNNLGFYCNEEQFKLFPPLDINYRSPYKINNAIIEISGITLVHYRIILSQLNSLGCKFLSIIIYEKVSVEDLLKLNDLILQLEFVSYELYLPFQIYNQTDIDTALKKTPHKITHLHVFSCPNEKHNEFVEDFFLTTVFSSKDIRDFKHCGVVDLKYFNTNITKYTESVNHNSCLHRKISIDRFGNIKNCPSLIESFGSITSTTLEQAMNIPTFTKYWDITKDQVEICQDCEFRHVCTDCRAFVEVPNNLYSKPLKCGYNPYTNKWDEWSTNPLKESAISHYSLEELVNSNSNV